MYFPDVNRPCSILLRVQAWPNVGARSLLRMDARSFMWVSPGTNPSYTQTHFASPVSITIVSIDCELVNTQCWRLLTICRCSDHSSSRVMAQWWALCSLLIIPVSRYFRKEGSDPPLRLASFRSCRKGSTDANCWTRLWQSVFLFRILADYWSFCGQLRS